MKTIEEMKKAVLAYCEEVCPNEHNTAHLEVGMLKRQSMGSVFYWLHVDGLSTIAIHEKATDDHIFAAYRILGLAERDAVAAEREKINKLAENIVSQTLEINALESRNTALVTLLTTMKENADQDDSDDATFRQWVFDAASYRLTANEKGVNHER